MTSILLVAINARYSHSSHASRLLIANLDPALRPHTRLLEFDLSAHPLQIAAEIVAAQAEIVGFTLYLWNTKTVRETLQILRCVAPETTIVLGGPEIVPGCQPHWEGLATSLILGEGEIAFNSLCRQLLADQPLPYWIEAPPPDLATLNPPYPLYSNHDLQRRVVHVETTRGCPHHCLYCTSCNTGLRRFPLSPIRSSFRDLLQRGLRKFRFLDRTFNADEAHACAILDIFLENPHKNLTLHLELSPVNFGQPLRQRLQAFPRGQLHLELGVQTLNPAVAHAIGRHEDRQDVIHALHFLTDHTGADLHVDLIFGLPGENLDSFASGFDLLVRLNPGAIQVNLLKVLPGTPLSRLKGIVNRHNPNPPYEVLHTDSLSFTQLMRLQRFAHVWDRLHNRGRFTDILTPLWQDPAISPFAVIDQIATSIYHQHGRVHSLSLSQWSTALDDYLSGN